jgi:DNA-binding CsgD family transcriptional regulator
MTAPTRYYINLVPLAWGEIPTLLPAGDSTSTPGALAENQVRLLNALARPILVADETGRMLYQTPTLRECLARASVQERIQLQRALDQAVTRLCSRLRNQSGAGASTRPVVLNRQVLTNRSEFRLRGVLVPQAVLLNQRGILLELERTGKRKIRLEDLCVHFGLTAREIEVATLVARGFSDQAIATRLGISPRTAEHHTEHLLRKLRVDCRSAVAALLARSNPD